MPEYPNFEDELKPEKTEVMDVQLENEEKRKEVKLLSVLFNIADPRKRFD